MLISFIRDGVYGYVREDRVGIYSFMSNNNLAIRRKAIVEAEGYDDSLRIAEDYDVCQRLVRAGWLLYFCPEMACSIARARAFAGCSASGGVTVGIWRPATGDITRVAPS